MKMTFYFLSLFAVLFLSWRIQEIHLGIGYAFGTMGILIAFLIAVNTFTKETRK
jgi:multidrug transporter EmrE-like cation transporter